MSIQSISSLNKATRQVVARPVISQQTQFIGGELQPVMENASTSISALSLAKNKQSTISITYTLGDNEVINLPEGSILSFTGNGKIKGGTIVGNNSTIIANKKVFENVKIQGTWKCPGRVEWFVEGTTNVNSPKNEYAELQSALDSSFTELIFPTLKLYTSSTLILKIPKKLILQGNKLRYPLKSYGSPANTTILFTKKDIDLLKIDIDNGEVGKYYKADTVEILGGNFDVSLCNNYSHSVIKVMADDDQRIWGLTINTNIIGEYKANWVNTGIGIDLNPIEISETVNNSEVIPNTDPEQTKIRSNVAYITNVRIDSDISYMGIGVKAVQWGDNKNWLTDVNIDGNIRYCAAAVDTNADCTINASIQAGTYWDSQQNDAALIYVRGGKTSVAVGGTIYDICMGGGTHWANRYAILTEEATSGSTASKVVPFGKFLAFLIGSGMYIDGNWVADRSLVKGRIYIPLVKESLFTGGDTSERSNSIIKNFNPAYTPLVAQSW